METTTHCAYNITRNTLISQRVTSVSNLPDLAGLLALVLNGPGRDSNSAVFLSQINGAIEIPRFFAFDIAYLDDDQRIIESTGVGPGTPFPPLTQGVASVLFLSDQCLAKSATTPGDLVTICTGPELAALLKAVSQPPPPEILLQTDPSPWTNPELRQSREPFDGSLIYLPASGPPQKTEFFLPIQALPPRMPDLSNEHPTESAPSELPGVEIPITRESAPIAPFQQPDEPATEQPAEPELPRFHEPAPVRFFHPAASIQAQPPRQSEAPAEADQPRVPRAPQLHTLEAVVRQIDAQLRRETKAHEPVPEEHFSVEQFTPPLPTQEPPELQLEIADEKVQAPFLAQVSDASEPVHSPPPLPAPVQDDFASASAERSEKAADILRSRSKEKLSFTSRVQRWLAGESVSLSGNRRRGERIALPGLVAFYWTGGAPNPHQIVNISSSGLYLRSKEIWSPDTLVRMTLERNHAEVAEKTSISVLVRVVRIDDGGIGHEFVMSEVLAHLRARDFLPEHGTNRKELAKFLALQ